jgi:parvulin-like peptidyl-prolyl isomerase
LRQQILTRKVVSQLDTEAHSKAEAALAELKSGASFADIAKKYSVDAATKDTGGEFPAAIDKSNRDISATVTSAVFSLHPGDSSSIIDTGYSLEIVKLNSFEGEKAHASHIQINFKDISVFLNPLKVKEKSKTYIKV